MWLCSKVNGMGSIWVLQALSAPLIKISLNFSQLEESKAKCAEAQRSQQTAALELENVQTELETLSRNKTLVWGQTWAREVGGWHRGPASLCLIAVTSIVTKSAIISLFTKSPITLTKSPRFLGNNGLFNGWVRVQQWIVKGTSIPQSPSAGAPFASPTVSMGLEATCPQGMLLVPMGCVSQQPRGSFAGGRAAVPAAARASRPPETH